MPDVIDGRDPLEKRISKLEKQHAEMDANFRAASELLEDLIKRFYAHLESLKS